MGNSVQNKFRNNFNNINIIASSRLTLQLESITFKRLILSTLVKLDNSRWVAYTPHVQHNVYFLFDNYLLAKMNIINSTFSQIEHS